MRIDVDFTEVPTSVPPIEAGKYKAQIIEEPVEHVNEKKGSRSLKVVMAIVQPDGPMDGRKIASWTGLTNHIGLKRLMLSAGLKAGKKGLDTEKLIDKEVMIDVSSEMYQDRPTASVRDYLLPGEFDDDESDEDIDDDVDDDDDDDDDLDDDD